MARWDRSPGLSTLVRDLACQYKYALLLPVKAHALRSGQGPALLSSTSSGTALMISKRAEGTAVPSAPSPRLGKISVQQPTSLNSKSCGFHTLQTRLWERRQRYATGNNFLETRSGGTYILCILTRMVTPPCFPNYNININTFPYLQAPSISNNFKNNYDQESESAFLNLIRWLASLSTHVFPENSPLLLRHYKESKPAGTLQPRFLSFI